MSEHAAEPGLSAADAAALRRDLDELREAYDELREATTAAERERAKASVSEEREDLDETARKLGISRASLDQSIAAAKRAERKQEIGPIVRELLDEIADEHEKAEAEEAEREAEAIAAGKPKGTPKPKPKPAAAADGSSEPPDDSVPIVEHWTEKRISEVLR